jgi:1-deoxy-D-xylulose-5-phosphate synthase
MVPYAMRAAEMLAVEGINVEVVNARFVKPLDTAMIDDVANRIGRIITVEDGQIEGGFGSAVAEYVAQHHGRVCDVRLHGIADIFVEHGTQEELHADLLLDAPGIAHVVRDFVAESVVREATRAI